jgi:hypothetical protein
MSAKASKSGLLADPYYRRFVEQKEGARRRGIGWELAYWQWLQIWQDSGHLHERGARGGCWVMARNGDVGPYSEENVRIVRCETNSGEAQKPKRRRLVVDA